MTATPAAAVFVREGDALVATDLASGPWGADAQHGGAPAALLAREVERCPSDVPMQVARITCEFMRPVPLGVVEVTAAVRRQGRRVELVDASLAVDGQEVARATALRIRTTSIDVPTPDDEDPAQLPAGDDTPLDLGRPWFGQAFSFRTASGSAWGRLGPCAIWGRLTRPLVEGEEPSPLMRVVALADFGNGISRVLDFTEHLFINPDLTVSLHRLPESEWILLDAVTRLDGSGMGLAAANLSDLRGSIGRSQQSLLVDVR